MLTTLICVPVSCPTRLYRVQSSTVQGTIDQKLGLTETDQAFAIPGKESRTFSGKLLVPDGQGFLSYKAVASTGNPGSYVMEVKE